MSNNSRWTTKADTDISFDGEFEEDTKEICDEVVKYDERYDNEDAFLAGDVFFLSDEDVDEKATVLTEGQNTMRALNGRVYFCIELQILRMTR